MISFSNIRTLPLVVFRAAFANRQFGEVPDGVEPNIAAWFWAFYASLGGHDQQARERAITEIRYMTRAALGVRPRVEEDGSLVTWPTDAERPYAPGAAASLLAGGLTPETDTEEVRSALNIYANSPAPTPLLNKPGCRDPKKLGEAATQALGRPLNAELDAHLADCTACALERIAFDQLDEGAVEVTDDQMAALGNAIADAVAQTEEAAAASQARILDAVTPVEEASSPTCLRCDGEHFNELRLLSEEDDDIVRREVQCSACSLTGILVAPRVEDEDADGFVGEWETQ